MHENSGKTSIPATKKSESFLDVLESKRFLLHKNLKENQLVYSIDVLDTTFVIKEIELNHEKRVEIWRA